jgi:hypothetical protein
MNKTGKFEDIEYIQVSRHGKIMGTYKGSEVNGKTKLQLQEMIGKDYGQDRFSLSINKTGTFTNTAMQIRGIILGTQTQKKDVVENENNSIVLDTLRKLEATIQNVNTGKENYSYDSILEMIKQSYQIRFDALLERISFLKTELEDCKSYIRELENEANNKSNIDISSMLSSVMQFKNLLSSKKPTQTLSDINVEDDIPHELLNVLSDVDYKSLPKKDLIKYISLLEQFSKNLPHKQQEEVA